MNVDKARMKTAVALVLGVALGAPVAGAQGTGAPLAPGDTLSWELVGQPLRAEGLFANDTVVYANGPDGLFRLRPGEEAWTFVVQFDTARDAFVSREGTLFYIHAQHIQRSEDGGQTWAEVLDGGALAPAYTPAGALLTTLDGSPTHTAARSTDDGRTWARIDFVESGGARVYPLAFAALPPSAALPGGRVVAGGLNGIVYSDDDGRTWGMTDVIGAYTVRVSSVVAAPWALPGAPSEGTLYAAVNDDGGVGGVWESADGAVWERVGQVPGADGSGSYLLFVPDGAGGGVLYATNPGEAEDLQVYVSHDRGRTWVGTGRIEAEEAVGNAVRIREVVLGPEGRLYVGFTDAVPGPKGVGGVFRTVAPVVAVGSEGGAPAGVGARLEAWPNPSGSSVAVDLAVDEPSEGHLAVYDVLGRRVAVLHEGALGIGAHRFVLDTRALPAGVYVVLAAVGGEPLSRRITVVR